MISEINWREVEPSQGMDLSRDLPPMQLARTNNKVRRWFKIEGGKVYAGYQDA